MYPQVTNRSAHGITFVMPPSMKFQGALSCEYLGLFNASTNGLSSNHVFAVELGTIQNAGFGDIEGNRAGIDVYSLNSTDAASASNYSDKEEQTRACCCKVESRCRFG